MTDPTELARVLAALDFEQSLTPQIAKTMADAARLLRALAADFERYGRHVPRCSDPTGLGRCACGFAAARIRWVDSHAPTCHVNVHGGPTMVNRTCTCGLDAARARWRLS